MPTPWPSSYALTVDLLTLVGTVVVVFLLNSLLEEVFYRWWLQTRWEPILGRRPALAAVVVNHGVLGLFLGYLWSTYRLMWKIVVVHGAINVAPIAISSLG